MSIRTGVYLDPKGGVSITGNNQRVYRAYLANSRPIRDFSATPSMMDFGTYQQGGALPSTKSQQVFLAELSRLMPLSAIQEFNDKMRLWGRPRATEGYYIRLRDDYNTVGIDREVNDSDFFLSKAYYGSFVKYRFELDFGNGSVKWLESNYPIRYHINTNEEEVEPRLTTTTPQTLIYNSDFLLEKQSHLFNFTPVDLDLLPPGEHVCNFSIIAFSKLEENNNVEIERFTTPMKIKIQAPANALITSIDTCNLVYNKANNSLSGDTSFLVDNPLPVKLVSATAGQNWLSTSQYQLGGNTVVALDKTTAMAGLAVGNYSDVVAVTKETQSKNISVNLQVVNNLQVFDLARTAMDISLMRRGRQVVREVVGITNPNNEPLSVESFPNTSLASATIVNGQLIIETFRSDAYMPGIQNLTIVVRCGQATKALKIRLNISDDISHTLTAGKLFFAKDKQQIVVKKTATTPTTLYIDLELSLNNGQQSPIKQSYSLPFFKEEASLDIGKVVQDFFAGSDVLSLSDYFSGINYATANITIKEQDKQGVVVATYNIQNVWFLPGKKPAAFPVMSNHLTRRFFKDSQMLIPYGDLNVWQDLDAFRALFGQSPMAINLEPQAKNHLLYANALPADQHRKAMQLGPITYLPVPNKKQAIHVFFENQNLCLDWFSASGVWGIKEEISPLLSETNAFKERKFGSLSKKTMYVNTGWILEEEIPLISELMASRICFIFIDGKQYTAFAINATNELQNSAEKTFNLDLEFRIIEND